MPKQVVNSRKENNLRRLSRIELSAILNKNLQTKKTRKYRQSESLLAAEAFKNERAE